MRSITLVPVEGVDRELLHVLREPLAQVFVASVDLQAREVAMERFRDRSREQYNSSQILMHMKETLGTSYLQSKRRDPFNKVYLAVSQLDLFVPVLTYVFGEAELKGNVAVVSYFRLQNERYGLSANRPLLVQRLIKEAVHELGHVYGLLHCNEPQCVMHSSTYVEDIDLKGDDFCGACRPLLGLA